MTAKKGMRSADLCRSLDIQPYVLRYWETEFRALQGEGSGSGQRAYSDSDVQLVRRIKALLYEEGYTIAGAKKKLESEPFEPAPTAVMAALSAEAAPSEAAVAERIDASGAIAGESELDTVSVERIEQLRRGIEEALATARSALKLLEKQLR
mgnify:CR=1 FL=1